MVNRYVHFASAQDMIQGQTSAPVDHLGIKILKDHEIDRILKALL
jgi:hypothetical protein